MRRFPTVLLLFLGAWTVALPAGAEERSQRFENQTAGISLIRPAGWHTASLQEIAANRERVRLADKELQAAVQKHATAPLFAFTKYQEPYPSLNPSIQVILRPLGSLTGQPPEEILRAAVAAIQKAAPDFAFVEEVHATEVSGLKAAHMKAKYTVSNTEGQTFKVLSRMWVAPRGAFVFLIGMSGPQEGPDVAQKEFQAVLASIQIQK